MKVIKIPIDKALDKLLERLDAAERREEEKQERERRWTPEEWYQAMKRRWYFHDTSWYTRLLNGYDGKGCTADACIPGCRFYEKEGRLEDSEIEEAIQGLSKPVEEEGQQEKKEDREEGEEMTTAEEEKQRKMKEYWDQFKGSEFWIWNRHLHLLQFLRTQGRCCFNHMIGEPEKNGKLMPLF